MTLAWKIEFPLIFLSLLLLSAWAVLRNSSVRVKYSLYIRLLAAACSIVSLVCIVISLAFETAIGIRSSRMMVLPLVIICPMYDFAMVCYAFMKGYRPARYIFGAALTFGLSFIVLIFTMIGVLPWNSVTMYMTPVGAYLGAVIISIGIGDKLITMKAEMQKAEIMYRDLVESSHDIIFSMDEGMTILSINKAVSGLMGYRVDEVIDRNLLDFIGETWDRRQGIDREIVEDYIRELREMKGMVSFRTAFKTNFTNEPLELAVKLEWARMEGGKDIILGKASLITDDIILQFLESEKHFYYANNYLSNARILIERLTRNLGKHLNQSELQNIRLALREILVNAIEHGNLDISYDEKTRLMNEDRYYDFIYERQNDPRYNGRRIAIEYSLEKDKVTYTVTDEGGGFDHERMLGLYAGNIEDDLINLQHGRGLLIATNIFDVIRFNEKGNEVTLVKYFSRPGNAAGT